MHAFHLYNFPAEHGLRLHHAFEGPRIPSGKTAGAHLTWRKIPPTEPEFHFSGIRGRASLFPRDGQPIPPSSLFFNMKFHLQTGRKYHEKRAGINAFVFPDGKSSHSSRRKEWKNKLPLPYTPITNITFRESSTRAFRLLRKSGKGSKPPSLLIRFPFFYIFLIHSLNE